jgi:hypothetical protein
MFRLLVTFCSVLLLCTTAGCIQDPTMQLHSAGVRGISPQGVLLNITMSVRNDNSFDILVRNVTTEVTLAGRHRLPTVVLSPNQWLRADTTTLVTVPVVIPWNQLAPIASTTLSTPQISYHAIGVADVTATRALEIDVNEYALEEQGTFSRAELLAAASREIPGVQINVQRRVEK